MGDGENNQQPTTDKKPISFEKFAYDYAAAFK